MSLRLPLLPAALLALALLAGCSGEPRILGDAASCPGPACTEDARERLEAIAALESVTTVDEVARSSRLDRGSSSTAVVGAEVTTQQQAREVGLEVLRELDAWPGHEAASALATVRSDPAVTVTGEARLEEQLDPGFYDPCPPVECAAAVSTLEQRLADEVDGLSRASAEVVGSRLVVQGRADRAAATLAARAALRLVAEVGLRVAVVAEVEVAWRGPLSLTLRLDEGQVCEQPPGVVVSCDQENSSMLSG